jgi:hypothetical protein
MPFKKGEVPLWICPYASHYCSSHSLVSRLLDFWHCHETLSLPPGFRHSFYCCGTVRFTTMRSPIW